MKRVVCAGRKQMHAPGQHRAPLPGWQGSGLRAAGSPVGVVRLHPVQTFQEHVAHAMDPLGVDAVPGVVHRVCPAPAHEEGQRSGHMPLGGCSGGVGHELMLAHCCCTCQGLLCNAARRVSYLTGSMKQDEKTGA